MRNFTAVPLIAAPVGASESYTVEAIKQPTQSWYFQRLMVSDLPAGSVVKAAFHREELRGDTIPNHKFALAR